MRLYIYLCLLALILQSYAQTTQNTAAWEGTSPGGFAAAISVSPTRLAIDDSVAIQLTLTYPTSHTPKVENLIAHLLDYDGFGAPPFSLVHHQLQPPVAKADHLLSQKLEIILSPQIPGKHLLTFYDISFAPLTAESQAVINIRSGLIALEVYLPSLEFDPHLILAPPMPLSLDLPVDLSAANRRTFITHPGRAAEAAQHNVHILHSKTLPWQIIPAIITLLILIAIVLSPEKMLKTTADAKLSRKDIQQQALQQLENLAAQRLQNSPDQAFFLELDQLMRSYLEEVYHIKAPSLTTSEFLNIAANTGTLHTHLRGQLKLFLTLSDQIKFAAYHPTPEETLHLLTAAAQVISPMQKDG